jgi:hypothetical protein
MGDNALLVYGDSFSAEEPDLPIPEFPRRKGDAPRGFHNAMPRKPFGAGHTVQNSGDLPRAIGKPRDQSNIPITCSPARRDVPYRLDNTRGSLRHSFFSLFNIF